MIFILASASPQRKKILKDAGYEFEIVHPEISENIFGKKPSQIVKFLALKKAKAISRNGIIIGADTIVVLDGEIIGKPKNENEARKILRKLSGSEHFVYTGVAILDIAGKKQIVDYEKTAVQFRKLSKKNIKGDYLNVVGFPLKKFQKMLDKILATEFHRTTQKI